MSMKHSTAKTLGRTRRHARIRSRVVGTAARPRLAVYKSNRYLHAQIIDDEAGKTIVSGTTKGMKAKKTEAAKQLGADLAKGAKAAGITSVVFDRGGFRYAGRVAELAAAARAGGLAF
ncbi:MAG TPA: 50S ribosomal protein L18 [Candidatus Paceibacterota bacterium]|nr:50S ribosomal protein L18 [Candidatus Paceibacterota bacterium]